MTDTPFHSVSVAGVTFDDYGRILVIRRRDNGEWQVPGGVLELGETFEEGVVREVLEETGIDVSVDGLTGAYKNIPRSVVALVYRCTYVAGNPSSTTESVEATWMDVDEALGRMIPAFAVRVTDALDASVGAASRAHDGVNLLR